MNLKAGVVRIIRLLVLATTLKPRSEPTAGFWSTNVQGVNVPIMPGEFYGIEES